MSRGGALCAYMPLVVMRSHLSQSPVGGSLAKSPGNRVHRLGAIHGCRVRHMMETMILRRRKQDVLHQQQGMENDTSGALNRSKSR